MTKDDVRWKSWVNVRFDSLNKYLNVDNADLN